ncbi:multiple coagulation factor deficiency protein 2 homolog [Branchiostoma lanceolatum]|uniref:multiple coagulation factor deficiency protein 2 homolog n=1 Tax=Branchiostoma lanceolatum TaxID=7740 RepID=UPI003453ADF2
MQIGRRWYWLHYSINMEFSSRLVVAISAFLFLVPHALCTGTDETPSNKFRDPAMTQDKDHLKEHVKELTEEQINEMSSEEKEFHFFKTHDSDKDLKLDGLEILAAIEHSTHFNTHEDKDMTEYYAELVDKVLADDDTDDDGMISWIEYVIASRRREVEAEAAHARKQKVA